MYLISIAIVKRGKVEIPVVGVAVAGQGPAADLHALGQGEGAIGEGVGGAGRFHFRQQVVFVGVLHTHGQLRVRGHGGGGQAVHAVVGILRPGVLGVLRVLHPLQHIGVGVVAVEGGAAHGVGGAHQPVAVGGVGGGGGHGD